MARQYSIGVVGLGIAGAASAALLARQGHSVTMFERAPHVGPVGAGLVLQPSGQAALRSIGLLDDVIASAEPLDGLDAMLPNRRTLVKLRYADIGHDACGYGVHRGELFSVLHRAAMAAGVEIRLGVDVTGCTEENEQTCVLARTGERYGPYDFVIAADGSRSRMAESLHPQGIEYSYGAIWLLGRNMQIRGRLHQVVSGTTRLLGLLPIGNERCTLFWGARKDEMDALVLNKDYTWWRDQVLALCPLAEETLDSAGGFERAVFTNYRHSVSRKPYFHHVVCLGDAAHAMSPHLGQGANLALADAVSFANALERSDEFEDACRRFDAERRTTIRYYASLSRILTPFFQSDVGVLAWGRNVALPIMYAVPPIRREMTQAMAGVKRGLFGSDADIKVACRGSAI